jgi:hypothetical protein
MQASPNESKPTVDELMPSVYKELRRLASRYLQACGRPYGMARQAQVPGGGRNCDAAHSGRARKESRSPEAWLPAEESHTQGASCG